MSTSLYRGVLMKNAKLILFLCALATSVKAHVYHEEFQQAGNQKIFSTRTVFPMNSANKIEGVPRNTIYITIDDGPTPKATPEVLRVLKKYNVQATFFVIGRNAKAYPSIMRQAYNDGHVITNHTYEHPLDFATSESFYNSLMATHNVLVPYQSNAQIQLFRAPGGVWNSWRAGLGNAHSVLRNYVGPIYWNAGGGNPKNKNDADWKCWSKGVSVSSCAASYLAQIRGNYARGTASLVLFHDVKVQSAQLLEVILASLEQDSVNWEFRLVEDIPAVQDAAR